MLNSELIKKANQIFIRSRRKVTDIFAGEFESAFRGRGIEFEEFREYVPGDDVRQIAWNVTARMDRPFVKVFREEREQTIFFLIDLSRSQNFGAGRFKREIVTEVAALLAYAAIKTNDKVGLVLFTDRVERYIPPKKGRAHVWRLIAEILSFEPQGKKTDVGSALKHFLSAYTRRATCFLMSDFWDANFEAGMNIAACRHDFIVVRVYDRVETSIPAGALMDFTDNETGGRVRVDLASTALRRDLSRDLSAREKRLADYFRSRGIDELKLATDVDYAGALLDFFIRREGKR